MRSIGRRLLLLGLVLACLAGGLAVAPRSVAAVGDTDLEVSVTGAFSRGLLSVAPFIDWTVTVTNSTADQTEVATATGVRVRDIFTGTPSTATRSSASVSTGSYSPGTWTVGTLAPGASATLTYRTSFALLTEPSGTVSAEVTAQGQRDLDSAPAEDADVGNQDDEAVFRAGAGTNRAVGDLVWNDLDGNGQYSVGEPGVRGVQVIVAAGGVRVYAGRTDATGTWSFPNVVTGSSVVVTFVPRSASTFTQAKIGTDDADSDAGPGGVTAARTVSADDLRIDAGLRIDADTSLTLSASSVSGGVPFTPTFTMQVANAGPGPAAGVVAAVRFPATAPVVGTPTPSQGSVVVASGTVTWTVGAIAPGGRATLTYQLRHTAIGTYESVAHVTAAATPDPDSTPNPVNSTCPANENDDCANLAVTATTASPTGSVAGTVWRDSNGDGQRQAAEPLAAGVTVRLHTGSDVLVASTTSSATGTWAFPDRPTGSYVVEVVAPAGAAFTVADVGPDATDSDVAPTTGRVTVVVASGATTAVDAGLVPSDRPTADVVLVPQGVAVSFNPLDNDAVPGRAPGTVLPGGWSWTRNQGAGGGSVTCSSAGACTYRSVADFAGDDTFTYTLTNPTFGPRTVTVTLTVLHVNDPPVARDDRGVTRPGVPVVVDLVANDEDPDAPSVAGDPNRPGDSRTLTATSAVSPPGAGTATCTALSCTLTPAQGFTGTMSLTYTVSDSGASDPRVASPGVPGGLSAVAPRSATAGVRVWVDPNPRPTIGFTGRVAPPVGTTGAGTWTTSAAPAAAASCVSGRPQVAVTWPAVARATGYRLERRLTSAASGTPWTPVATVGAASTSVTDALVGEERSYTYRLVPLRHRWTGTATSSAAVTTPSATSPAGCG